MTPTRMDCIQFFYLHLYNHINALLWVCSGCSTAKMLDARISMRDNNPECPNGIVFGCDVLLSGDLHTVLARVEHWERQTNIQHPVRQWWLFKSWLSTIHCTTCATPASSGLDSLLHFSWPSVLSQCSPVVALLHLPPPYECEPGFPLCYSLPCAPSLISLFIAFTSLILAPWMQTLIFLIFLMSIPGLFLFFVNC